jgi:hypothetical protein
MFSGSLELPYPGCAVPKELHEDFRIIVRTWIEELWWTARVHRPNSMTQPCHAKTGRFTLGADQASPAFFGTS